jgi:hypothetical protein
MKSGMDIFRRGLFCLLVGFLVAVAPEARGESSAATGSTEGTFVGIEQGDYAHFLIKDKKGKDDSFIVLRPDKSVQPYLDNPAKFKGGEVRVHWKEQTIPEAGGKMKTVIKVQSQALNPANSAETKLETRSFAAFWVEFKTAVANDDREAIAKMTKLPFVYGTSKPLSKADFIKECAELFNQKTRRCFSKAKPVKDDGRDSYSVFCGEEIFSFEKVNGEYRFTDVGMND